MPLGSVNIFSISTYLAFSFNFVHSFTSVLQRYLKKIKFWIDKQYFHIFYS